MVEAKNFIGTLAVNVDNPELSDAEFRAFVRRTLPIIEGSPDPLERYKNLCLYCRDGYRAQKFPNGRWGHDDVPEYPQYGSWPHDCKAGDALEAELTLVAARKA